MLNKQELEAQRAAIIKRGPNDPLIDGNNNYQLGAEDSIMEEAHTGGRAAPDAGSDPLMDPSAFIASTTSRTATGA